MAHVAWRMTHYDVALTSGPLQVLPTARLTLARTLKRMQAPDAGSLHTPLDTLAEQDSEVEAPVPQPSAGMAPARRPGDSRSAAVEDAVNVAEDSKQCCQPKHCCMGRTAAADQQNCAPR